MRRARKRLPHGNGAAQDGEPWSKPGSARKAMCCDAGRTRPDVAVLPFAGNIRYAFNEGMVKYIYFIAETKGSMESLQLKKIESAKISCAKKLFEKLGSGAVRYDVADTYQHLMDIMRK